jgi:hypothetical protein
VRVSGVRGRGIPPVLYALRPGAVPDTAGMHPRIRRATWRFQCPFGNQSERDSLGVTAERVLTVAVRRSACLRALCILIIITERSQRMFAEMLLPRNAAQWAAIMGSSIASKAWTIATSSLDNISRYPEMSVKVGRER